MQISVLASGSSGNVTYVETKKHKILIDAGLSGKKIDSLLKSIGKKISDIDSILVTHEHNDHIRGVGVLARKYNINVYANSKTWEVMDKKVGKIDSQQKKIFKMGTIKSFDDLDIESFGVSHDAAMPQFYSLHQEGKTFTILTDTGYVSERLEDQIKDSDGYLIECNHNVEMLRAGKYPWNLKQRILSDTGHLSNEDSANVLVDILGNQTKKIFLGHLSRENNVKELAHLTVESIMKERDLNVGHDFLILDTDPKKATDLIEI